MNTCWLYAIFHFNLAFSSIPKSHFSIILDRCYWPLLELAQRMHIPFGLEATGYTLEILNQLDPSFVQALKKAWQANQIEFVGASYTQSIFPLAPAEVNRKNLKLGQEVYESLLGNKPVTAYVNEQTYSSGLVDLYTEAGYKHLVMEWNNPACFGDFPSKAKWTPQIIQNPTGDTTMTVVWNNSILFQKLQRYLAKGLSLQEYVAFLEKQIGSAVECALPFYGSDAEIIDYHPGKLEAEYHTSAGAVDLQRLVTVLETIKANKHYKWTSPSGLVNQLKPNMTPIRLETPEYPLPCKKQPKYNPTRWAVSGRDDIRLNTQVYQLYSQMQALASLSPDDITASMWRGLMEVWASDFRTHTTNEKMLYVQRVASSLEMQIETQLIAHQSKQAPRPHTVVLWNPNNSSYTGPLSLEIQFPPKIVHGMPHLIKTEEIIAYQLESIGYYQDGSVRWVKTVVDANLPAQRETILYWESGDSGTVSEMAAVQTDSTFDVKTEQVKVSLLGQRGGAVSTLQFPQLDDKPWVGTIPHGHFDDIRYGADFYSGHMVMTSKQGIKATDLQPAQIQMPGNVDSFKVRIPIQVGLNTPLGPLWKTLYVYQNYPRIDLLYHFRFKDVSGASFRVGMMTALPEAFDHETLAYQTVNGGIHPEKFLLKGHTVTHGDPVSVSVSAQHGVGATEGWIAIEDKDKRMILQTYPGHAYAMPMVSYHEIDPNYFLRIQPSIGEFDDTSHTLWRGHHQVMFSWRGQKSSGNVEILQQPVSLSAHATILPV